MLPQSRTLEEGDHAGKRQSAKGSLLPRRWAAGRAHSRGERARNANQAPSPEITGKGSVSSHVFVLDKRKRPLMPCLPVRAKRLLSLGRAGVHRVYPFTIRLKFRTSGNTQPVQLKLDPGSRTTGLALLREDGIRQHVFWMVELEYRGEAIRASLTQRRAFRRHRSSANLQYQPPRFNNRARPEGWIAPSSRLRVDTTMSWVNRLGRLAPITGLSVELVRFDTLAMQNPEISGVEYQQGTLAGYELREYLLEKWGREGVYCGARNVPLEIDYIHPKSLEGSDRVSNLTLACQECNQAKGNQPVEKFLSGQPERLDRILAKARATLWDAVVVNSTRWALFHRVKETGLSVNAGTSGRTKWNRSRLSIPKAYCLDAVCVGGLESAEGWNRTFLKIKASGRGSYQRTWLNQHGFSRGYLMRRKVSFGFQTGEIARVVVPMGKKAGTYVGRIAIRASGSFKVQTADGVVQGVPHRFYRLLHRNDGYGYSHWTLTLPSLKGRGISRGVL
ncbi:HNH endonuclease [Candidatus Methylacidiphilum fumarolicum]|nr:RNA-guided endonuclease IscB [Candidatus Methylacidiphilum fumarolicum]TFE72905.1 HNH endonuclease [Candidatus Methylacidiphilum fumarolicum]TFE74648.1 HNH endonuclease [Candidatus Methylacidiphilum fumarolicum]